MSWRALLVFVELVAGSIWLGGFVAIVVISRIARQHLEPAQRVGFFRALGRSYGLVSGIALVVALAAGAALLADHGWDGTVLVAVILAVVLACAVVAGVVQARGMTRLRRLALAEPDAGLTERVRRGSARAKALRATIGALTIALTFVAALLAA